MITKDELSKILNGKDYYIIDGQTRLNAQLDENGNIVKYGKRILKVKDINEVYDIVKNGTLDLNNKSEIPVFNI